MITFTNYFQSVSGKIPFLSLSKEKQATVGNHIRREPLTQFGEVKERRTA